MRGIVHALRAIEGDKGGDNMVTRFGQEGERVRNGASGGITSAEALLVRVGRVEQGPCCQHRWTPRLNVAIVIP